MKPIKTNEDINKAVKIYINMPKTLTNVNARPKNLDIENVIKIPKNTYF